MNQRNPIKRQIEEDRKWGMIHRDKKKFNRGPPNHHQFDLDIEEAWEELVTQSQEWGLHNDKGE